MLRLTVMLEYGHAHAMRKELSTGIRLALDLLSRPCGEPGQQAPHSATRYARGQDSASAPTIPLPAPVPTEL